MKINSGMSTMVALGALLAAALSGCIAEGRVVVRDPPPPAVAPPPPPADDVSASAEADEAQPAPPPPGQEVETATFYDRLSPYGHWQYVEDYGRVWVPSVAVGWRPYTYGRWVLTDWGWTFVSDDPWGWAAYHYGSWGFGASVGWYWVPGRVWAPAWVSWRYGGGYVTWAPIGPRGYIYPYNHAGWVAVGEQHFTQPIATVAIRGQATAGIVQVAQPLGGPHAAPVRGGSFGPPVASVQAAVGHPIVQVSARAAIAQPHAGVAAPMAQGAPHTAAGAPAAAPHANAPNAAPASRAQPGSAAAARPGAAAVAPQPAARANRPAQAAGGNRWSRSTASGRNWSRGGGGGGGGAAPVARPGGGKGGGKKK